MTFFAAPPKVPIDELPSDLNASLSATAAGRTVTIAKLEIVLNSFGSTLAANADGANLFDANTVFNYRPEAKDCPEGNHGPSHRTVGSLLFKSSGPRTMLAADTPARPQYLIRADRLFLTTATDETSRTPPITFFQQKISFDDNPISKFGSYRWSGVGLNLVLRRAQKEDCYGK